MVVAGHLRAKQTAMSDVVHFFSCIRLRWVRYRCHHRTRLFGCCCCCCWQWMMWQCIEWAVHKRRWVYFIQGAERVGIFALRRCVCWRDILHSHVASGRPTAVSFSITTDGRWKEREKRKFGGEWADELNESYRDPKTVLKVLSVWRDVDVDDVQSRPPYSELTPRCLASVSGLQWTQ